MQDTKQCCRCISHLQYLIYPLFRKKYPHRAVMHFIYKWYKAKQDPVN